MNILYFYLNIFELNRWVFIKNINNNPKQFVKQ